MQSGDATLAKFVNGCRLASTVKAGFALLEQLLFARLAEAPHGLYVVQYAIAEIDRHHGTLSIRALSDQIGISPNHLGTQFKRLVGIPPKEVARFYRFAYLAQLPRWYGSRLGVR